MATKQQIAIEFLEKKGYKRVESRSTKYLVFAHPNQSGVFYYVGKNGALRKGKTIADSFSISSVVTGK